MSPEASSQDVPAQPSGESAGAWLSRTCQLARARVSASATSSGSNRAFASSTARSMVTAPHEEMRPTSWRSTYAAACRDSRAVARATRWARQAGTSSDSTLAAMRGRRWLRFSASAISWSAVDVETPQGGAELLGRERRDERGAIAADRLVAVEGLAAEPRTRWPRPVSLVAGLTTHHW